MAVFFFFLHYFLLPGLGLFTRPRCFVDVAAFSKGLPSSGRYQCCERKGGFVDLGRPNERPQEGTETRTGGSRKQN